MIFTKLLSLAPERVDFLPHPLPGERSCPSVAQLIDQHRSNQRQPELVCTLGKTKKAQLPSSILQIRKSPSCGFGFGSSLEDSRPPPPRHRDTGAPPVTRPGGARGAERRVERSGAELGLRNFTRSPGLAARSGAAGSAAWEARGAAGVSRLFFGGGAHPQTNWHKTQKKGSTPCWLEWQRKAASQKGWSGKCFPRLSIFAHPPP